MEEKNKPVETKVENAGTQQPNTGDKTNITSETPTASTEKSSADLLLEVETELQKVREDRNNYRTATLKAKGKSEDGKDVLTDEDRIREIAREELLANQEKSLSVEREKLLASVIKENKELKIANRNKSGAVTTPTSGGTQEKPEVPPVQSVLDPAVRAELEKRWEKDPRKKEKMAEMERLERLRRGIK
ncbi:hypothetical protein M1506_00275 [Patescibacteria group bacterium]|nr:hypothetical protein [Patescibacteria group bacterium]